MFRWPAVDLPASHRATAGNIPCSTTEQHVICLMIHLEHYISPASLPSKPSKRVPCFYRKRAAENNAPLPGTAHTSLLRPFWTSFAMVKARSFLVAALLVACCCGALAHQCSSTAQRGGSCGNGVCCSSGQCCSKFGKKCAAASARFGCSVLRRSCRCRQCVQHAYDNVAAQSPSSQCRSTTMLKFTGSCPVEPALSLPFPGFCGETDAHCGAGCQSPFGRCNGGGSRPQPSHPQPQQPDNNRHTPRPERGSSNSGDDACGEMLGMVNDARAKAGARPLRCASELFGPAKRMSDDMARNNRLPKDHKGGLGRPSACSRHVGWSYVTWLAS